MHFSTPALARHASQRGISLFELLLTVSLLGVLLSLAMPLFGAQNDAFTEIQAKRNAQELVSECQTAANAGVHFIVANDLPATLSQIAQGQTATSGIFKGRHFGLRNLTPEALQGAARFLRLQGDSLALR